MFNSNSSTSSQTSPTGNGFRCSLASAISRKRSSLVALAAMLRRSKHTREIATSHPWATDPEEERPYHYHMEHGSSLSQYGSWDAGRTKPPLQRKRLFWTVSGTRSKPRSGAQATTTSTDRSPEANRILKAPSSGQSLRNRRSIFEVDQEAANSWDGPADMPAELASILSTSGLESTGHPGEMEVRFTTSDDISPHIPSQDDDTGAQAMVESQKLDMQNQPKDAVLEEKLQTGLSISLNSQEDRQYFDWQETKWYRLYKDLGNVTEGIRNLYDETPRHDGAAVVRRLKSGVPEAWVGGFRALAESIIDELSQVIGSRAVGKKEKGTDMAVCDEQECSELKLRNAELEDGNDSSTNPVAWSDSSDNMILGERCEQQCAPKSNSATLESIMDATYFSMSCPSPEQQMNTEFNNEKLWEMNCTKYVMEKLVKEYLCKSNRDSLEDEGHIMVAGDRDAPAWRSLQEELLQIGESFDGDSSNNSPEDGSSLRSMSAVSTASVVLDPDDILS
ncbi:hypothetical protein B0H66DRAFT_361076 [Apodospora peruviana]|uniref:Uncharacterized protein n=1 Tax=Apodospora peruviana TaxID=516989 RepID=A0AAE0HW08_9PEZI|nr:hypothetical protein B0H66DRAFT_361076 [Apodospora peruviana]